MRECYVLRCNREPTWQAKLKKGFCYRSADEDVLLLWCDECFAYTRTDPSRLYDTSPLPPLATSDDFWKELNS